MDPHPFVLKSILDAKIYMTLQYPVSDPDFFLDIFEKFHPIPPWVKYCRPLKMVVFENIPHWAWAAWDVFPTFFLNEIF